jgi:hypothetical protein
MASPGNALVCALIATAFWSLVGYALGCRLVPRVLAIGSAPVVGWSVHSAATLPIYLLFGFSPFLVAGIAAVCILVAGVSLSRPRPLEETECVISIPALAFAAAALVALLPAATILPKSGDGAVWLADATFDHAKVAIIDAMARLGLPPVNPVIGEADARTGLAYYYLWHFSAAEIALVTARSGWEADVALTWFTAFASLTLMMGLAVWLSKRGITALFVVALAAAGSLWVPLYWIFQVKSFAPVLAPPIGMGGWLFQATWAPQHLMAASCVVTAVLLLTRYALRQNLPLVVTIALLVVAAFESSAFVGGIAFAVGGLIAAPMLLGAVDPQRRLRFLGGLGIAALLVVCLIMPFVRDQLTAIAARGGARPIAISPYRVFGGQFPYWLRHVMDVPGYWLIILPIELPATFIAGVIAFGAVLRSVMREGERLVINVFACLAAAGLVVSWLLASTLGTNNDLGLRAILLAEVVLIVVTAAGMAGLPSKSGQKSWRALIMAAALGGLALGVPDFVLTMRDNVVASPQPPDAKAFAETPDLWYAARRYAGPAARVANNPRFLADLTPWPVNISWALLADRSSCFAGREMAIALVPLPPERRAEIDAEFLRVFNGDGTSNDVHDLATKFDCDVVLVVLQDKAWDHDPFAGGPDYRLAETREGRWRIYVREK